MEGERQVGRYLRSSAQVVIPKRRVWVRGICCSVAAKSGFLRLRCAEGRNDKIKEGLAECECQLETDHHRFCFQSHAPDFLDALLDLVFQPENLGGGGPAAVHDG
jgi:hypothetical protein